MCAFILCRETIYSTRQHPTAYQPLQWGFPTPSWRPWSGLYSRILRLALQPTLAGRIVSSRSCRAYLKNSYINQLLSTITSISARREEASLHHCNNSPFNMIQWSLSSCITAQFNVLTWEGRLKRAPRQPIMSLLDIVVIGMCTYFQVLRVLSADLPGAPMVRGALQNDGSSLPQSGGCKCSWDDGHAACLFGAPLLSDLF